MLRPGLEYRGEAVAQFLSLQRSLYITTFISVIGGGFFLATAIFIRADRAKADKIVRDSNAAAAAAIVDSCQPMITDSTTIPDPAQLPNGVLA